MARAEMAPTRAASAIDADVVLRSRAPHWCSTKANTAYMTAAEVATASAPNRVIPMSFHSVCTMGPFLRALLVGAKARLPGTLYSFRMIRTAIIGYGNLGRSVEKVISAQPDMELVGIFSRRDQLDTTARVLPAAEVEKYTDEVDVLFVCLGSATDVPEQAPVLARLFTTVDTYDNHHEIPKHRAAMDAAAREGGHVAMISTGWDPGLFSLNRVLGRSVLPGADQMTFWGPGLSQGHSDAVRRVPGVKKGVQYTLPKQEAVEAVKRGEGAGLKGNECHLRHVVVVAEQTGDETADQATRERIRETIVTMPDYFEPYQTEVEFVTDEVFDRDHQGMPHGGQVITRGQAGESGHVIEFQLTLDRNPDFTAAVQVAYGRAAHRLREAGEVGARTVFEVAPHLLSSEGLDELVANNL